MRKSGLLKNLCLVCSCLGLGIFNSALALDSPPLITRQPTLELKPIPSEAFQLAKATFLPDYVEGPFSGYSTPIDYNPKGDCDDTSSLYTKNNCTYPKTVVSSSQCPFKPGYYKECKCLPKFKLTSCRSPYILGGVSCDGKYEKCVCPSSVSMYYPNDYCTQYCEGKCIAKSCSPDRDETGCQYGTGSTSDGCGGTRIYCKACSPASSETGCQYGTYSCSDGCGGTRSCCSSKPADPCEGVTGKTCSAGYHCSSYGSCGQCTGCSKDYVDPCSGVRCGSNAYCSGGSCYCNAGYSGNAYSGCSKTDTHTHSYSCPSGYQSSSCSSSQNQLGTANKICSCGATSGTCYKCQDKGKTCTAETCSNYTLSSKSDSNANYSSCTPVSSDCSTGSTKYKKTGCKSGYHDEGGSCKKDCEAGCSGYSLSTCPSNANCNSCTKKKSNCSNGSKVYKITSCKSGYTLSGSSCVEDKK